MAPQVSMKAVARTMVQGIPLARSICSAACLARNSPMGWRGDAPATETRTKAAPVQAAASIRWAWPARSTEAGEAPAGPGEAVHGGDNRASAAQRPGDGGRVADITVNHLYL